MIIFTAAWRLFFPAAGLFAGLAIPVWLLIYADRIEVMPDPLNWHMHEMLFGYLPAALAGFLLTALPNWTGRPGMKGLALAAFFSLWLCARIAMFFAQESLVTTGVAAAFLPVLMLIAAREIILSGNMRNLIVVVLLGGLAFAQGLMLAGHSHMGINAGFAIAAVLMVLIGGRITPAFSRNWLKMQKSPSLPAPFGRIDKVAMVITPLALLLWVIFGLMAVTGLVATIATCALALRLSRWRGWAVRSEPLLFGQHIAYFWLVIGMALLAIASLGGDVLLSQIRHAFGAGAIASMTMIVMQRAALGHSGRPVKGGRIDWLMLAALHVGAGLRIASPWVADSGFILTTAGLIWALSFLLFTIRILPIALAPRHE